MRLSEYLENLMDNKPNGTWTAYTITCGNKKLKTKIGIKGTIPIRCVFRNGVYKAYYLNGKEIHLEK